MESYQIILLLLPLLTGIIQIIIKLIDESSILKKMDKINEIYPNSTIEESGNFIKKTKKKYYFLNKKDNKI